MGCSCFLSYLLLGLLALVGFFAFKLRKFRKMFWFSTAKWDNTPRDVLILHCIPRGKCIPSPSPFVLKLETYLRMADIAYEVDTEDAFGPTGKTPWITLNSVHVADSQLIIEYLNKKLDKNLNVHLTGEQKAFSRTVRIMLEEHAFWGLVHWRWVGGIKSINRVMSLPPLMLKVAHFIMNRRITQGLWAQGLGRINKSDMIRFVEDDIRNVSALLGKKKFINGETPCEDDAAVFGSIAQVVWATHGSPYEKVLNEECPNLKEYCIRMRDKYWPDWNEICTEQGTN